MQPMWLRLPMNLAKPAAFEPRNASRRNPKATCCTTARQSNTGSMGASAIWKRTPKAHHSATCG
eukprot:9446665-Lingulodinium_polyedra.AAC.1